MTIFSNPGHAYMTVAGLRLDTSAADDPSDQQGPRWRPLRPPAQRTRGFSRLRHPLGALSRRCACRGAPASSPRPYGARRLRLSSGRLRAGRPAETQ